MNSRPYIRRINSKKKEVMSLLMKTAPVSEAHTSAQIEEHMEHIQERDEMTLVMRTTNTQTSTMSEKMKQTKQNASPSLNALFLNTVEDKGELSQLKTELSDNDELEVEGISQMTLHSFLLKAEELGKNITYTRTLKVEITD